MPKFTIPSALAAAALIGLASPAGAATAHNSQAGAWGPNSHICAPTPYFPEGGCVSAYIAGQQRDPFDTPGAREPADDGDVVYRERPRLRALDR